MKWKKQLKKNKTKQNTCKFPSKFSFRISSAFFYKKTLHYIQMEGQAIKKGAKKLNDMNRTI